MEQIFIAESFRFTARLDWGSDFSEQGTSERLLRRDWVEQRSFLRGFEFKLSDYFPGGELMLVFEVRWLLKPRLVSVQSVSLNVAIKQLVKNVLEKFFVFRAITT